MSKVFGSEYAGAYDTLYKEKDYDSECALLEKIFRQYSQAPVHTVLDLGCGTGNHALRLAAKDYEVTGVDLSSDMLRAASAKARERGLAIRFQECDMCRLQLPGTFDACVIMFAALGYQIENENVLAALRGVRQHLRAGGILVFDVWYGPAVLAQRPGERTRVIKTVDGMLLRSSNGRLDTYRQLCAVDYRVWHIRDRQLQDETQETHQMRYFFPQELKLFLQVAGFELLRLGAFPDLEQVPDETTWNIMAVARAI